VGRNHLLAFLQNFLSLLGYWNTTYFVIVFLEYFTPFIAHSRLPD